LATNSSERPGAKNALVAARASSTTMTPLATVEPPGNPLLQRVLDQPLGRLLPENSAPTVGARMTSPSAAWPT
jgi:hypothetical protein